MISSSFTLSVSREEPVVVMGEAIEGFLPDVGAVRELLAEEYGLDVEITRIADGEGSFNFRGDSGRGLVFVKVYRQGAGQQTQEVSCRQSEFARSDGVPTAALILSRSRMPVVVKYGLMVSVWEWVEGATHATVEASHAKSIGETLGRIHATFRDRFGVAVDAPSVARWHAKTVEGLTSQIIELRTQALAGCGRPGCLFDEIAVRTLNERLGDLGSLDELRIGTRGLTVQVIHGDYAPPNLILSEHQIAAVVDFGPPDPFLISYELGRIAYFPPISANRGDWYATALEVIRGYLGTCSASYQDVVMAPRVATIQLLTSLYGIREHFKGNGMFQDRLDAFWLARHEAARALIEDLPTLESALSGLAGAHPFVHHCQLTSSGGFCTDPDEH